MEEPERVSLCKDCPDEETMSQEETVNPQVAEEAPRSEGMKMKVVTTIEKYEGDRHEFESLDDFLKDREPYEVLTRIGNLGLNNGIQRLLDLLIGAGGTAYNNANSRIGVGNSSTAAAASQTDLQAAAGSSNRYFRTMEATFPSRSSQTVTWKSSFGSSDGNFAWQEWGIDNGTAAGTTVTTPMLNRKVESMGTKSAGTTWVLTVTITVS